MSAARRLLATTAGEDETVALGRRLAARLVPDGVLLLSGDLGAGKTVLARGVAAGLGLPPDEVQSPTYTLVREHRAPSGQRLVHLDLYRLEPEEAAELGLDETFAAPGVKVVEWAERLVAPPPGALALELVRVPGGREVWEVGGGEEGTAPGRPIEHDSEEERVR
ncbi:MAG TPA: tRNA (adenosine(37)-N6)-threonylcarbamoyltransferase complex ATPase subunit type 1 TsaE [Thermoanaerobaculia bacterium]|nr:tRNA (adenosine(37)-N6)-threonylcarbamoyltransferase complex ATPase subunit type 1 TsaE [Thermoanaerobaculia bacterium]